MITLLLIFIGVAIGLLIKPFCKDHDAARKIKFRRDMRTLFYVLKTCDGKEQI